METHRDDDFLEDSVLQQLRQKADKMKEQKLSEITAGREGESVLEEWEHEGIKVRHLPDDPLRVLRVSVGGWHGELGYCVFRGSKKECLAMLERAVHALWSDPPDEEEPQP